ncbi:hypothetical protein MIMGU_mgv11b0192772mg, partial [Erythranthe guttata]
SGEKKIENNEKEGVGCDDNN